LAGDRRSCACRISEALQLHTERIDFAAQAITFESLKKRKRGVYRAVPVPPAVLMRGIPPSRDDGRWPARERLLPVPDSVPTQD
jgi:integrase